ncbi:MAG: ABC-2 family transporter protein, partial [Bdellovibrionaceae bacterium]|nr:ABC-2 family transporter protein [Pseudobdellovibrionaceae bacterium]
MAFFRKNLGFSLLAIQTQLEYRLNFFVDAIIQPLLTVGIEFLLWFAVFRSIEGSTVAGFTLQDYLAYAIWAPFFARIAVNWMYEYRMISEIETGSVNTILTRPVSFYEYYLSQFMGYKFITTAFSFTLVVVTVAVLGLPTLYHRIPLALVLVFYYLLLVYSMSFFIASWAFWFNRVYSFTAVKNLSLWLLTGEIIPHDLVPQPLRDWI